MVLKMAIGETTIDSIPVEANRCDQPGYLNDMQRQLRMKHFDEILKSRQKPVFYLEVASGMNKKDNT